MSEILTKEEDLKYQLMEFSNTDPQGLNTEFEVCYENAQGMECWQDVCAIELAKRALKRIEKLETEIESYKLTLRANGVAPPMLLDQAG